MVANLESHPAGSTRSRSTSLSSSDTESRVSRSIRTRSRSRSIRSTRQIDRIYSGRHIDDQSVYHSGEDDYDGAQDSDAHAERVESGLEVRGGIVNERDYDLERNAQPADLEKSRTARSERSRDPTLVSILPSMKSERLKLMAQVTWNGPDDPDNPKNWPAKKKWAAVVTVSSFTFISPVASSMVAPALQSIRSDFGIEDQVVSQLTLSIFVLAYAIGPLFLGPFSEIYGRVIVLQLANLFFLVFNIACGVAKTEAQMIVFRFLAGLGGSAPLAVSPEYPLHQRPYTLSNKSRSAAASYPTVSNLKNEVKVSQSTALHLFSDQP